MSTTEMEQTARLTKKQYDTLLSHLNQNYTPVKSFKRFMVRFIKDKVDVRNPLDIRYKWTSGVNELVIKKGALGSQKRQETTISLSENQIEQFVRLFSLLGYKKGIAMFREIERFKSDYVEVSLGIAGEYYFVEVEALNSTHKKAALKNIADFFSEVEILPLGKKEYLSFLRLCDREVNFHFKLEDFPQVLLATPYWKKVFKLMEY